MTNFKILPILSYQKLHKYFSIVHLQFLFVFNGRIIGDNRSKRIDLTRNERFETKY